MDNDQGRELHVPAILDRRLSRRQVLGAGAAAAGAAFLAACSTSSSASQAPAGSAGASAAGGFNLINFFTTEDDPATQAVVTAAAEAFSGKNPGTEITQILMSNADRDQRILTGLSVGQDLGLFECGAPYRGQFIDAGYLYPLDDLIAQVGADQFPAGTRSIVNGHDYVFPYGGGPISAWSRSDRVPTQPTSYADLKSIAQQNTGGGKYGLAIASGGFGPFDYIFPPMVWANGGDYFDPQGNVVFDSPQVGQAIQDYVDLLAFAPSGNTNWTFYSLIDAYLSERVAMSFYPGRLGTSIPGKAPQLESITQVEPTPFGPVDVHEWRWSYLAIDAKTKNPDLAKAFIKFLLTDKNGVAYANSVPGQLIPAVKIVRDAALGDTSNAYVQKHKDWLTTLYGQIDKSTDISGSMGVMSTGQLKLYNGLPAPWASTAWGINPVDMQMMQKIVLEKMSVKDGQAWAVSQYKGMVADYKAKHPNWKPYSG